MSRSLCRTGKKEYVTEEVALEDMKVILARPSQSMRRPGTEKDPIRAYYCKFCLCWHLTSQRPR